MAPNTREPGGPGLRTAVVVDQWELFRLGIEQVLTKIDVRVLASTSNAADGLQAMRSGGADLFIVGKSHDLKREHALREVKGLDPPRTAVALVERAEPRDVGELLAAGVDGLLLRSVGGSDLADALLNIEAGERAIAPALAAATVGRVGPPSGLDREDDAFRSGLSPKELEVLAVLARGASYREIAEALIVTQATVKTHLVHIYAKLGVRNREQAVARALALGLLT